MRTIDYDRKDDSGGSTENQIAADEGMDKKFGNMQRAYNEGFAASDGVRPETAETDGRMEHPETQDESHPERKPTSVDNENPGLADN